MSYAVRILIALGGLAVFAFIIISIRKSKMVISDSIFWFLFAIALMLLALYPEVIFYVARKLHVASASNLAFLVMIAFLLVRVFQQDLKISQLTTKLQNFVQDSAIYEIDKKDASTDASQENH